MKTIIKTLLLAVMLIAPASISAHEDDGCNHESTEVKQEQTSATNSETSVEVKDIPSISNYKAKEKPSTTRRQCGICWGRGTKTCITCNGKGWFYGSVSPRKLTCTTCRGTGRVVCRNCKGTGYLD